MSGIIVAHFEEPDDDGIFQTLRGIELLRVAGAITEAQYQKGFQILNSATGVRCACGAIPALIYPASGGPAVCASCYQEAARCR